MVSDVDHPPRYAEFFCGGGMVHAGLSDVWQCAFANDIDAMKCDVYRTNWPAKPLIQGDIADVQVASLQHPIDLYWASSPCQDFSLAGNGTGLAGNRSGVFKEWVRLIREADQQGYAPRIIAFENVIGLLTRNHGADFKKVLGELAKLGYRMGAMEIDASHFLPQSRPRLFLVGVRADLNIAHLDMQVPNGPFHTAKIKRFVDVLGRDAKRRWIWWHHTMPHDPVAPLQSVIDPEPDTTWLSKEAVKTLLSILSEGSARKIAQARARRGPQIGMLYKRGRPDGTGGTRQRAEVRFDGLAGCLRTPAGGSSRQTVLFVDGKKTRARLLSTREVTVLMGLPADFKMPQRYNQAYHVAGDGVAVPIVRYLDQQLFQPLLGCVSKRQAA